MRNVLMNQQPGAERSLRNQSLLNAAVWTMQVLLALLFLYGGGTKLVLPSAYWLALMKVPLSGSFIRFIGVVEVAGALGLILPWLTRIKPWLTSLAACGLALEMIGAMIVSVIGSGMASALFPLIVGLLAAAIAYGRRPGRRSTSIHDV